jgi:hypothetical protein
LPSPAGGDGRSDEAQILQAALPEKRLRSVIAGSARHFSPSATVLSQAEIQTRFGAFTVKKSGDSFTIDPAWVADNIIRADVPVLGTVVGHRKMLPDLRAAMAELEDSGLADLVDSNDFQRAGGAYNPRTVRFDTALSHHSWGIAVDINVARNPLGAPPDQDPRLVRIMEKHNFTWGGRWLRPDAAHFEWFGTPSSRPQATG